ncbi:MAG: hypothetical protein HY393_03800 [Candidatus Diapherotrites archaeon]|nr:hypothetical protein [Candidatus Diapherotrites archaeon]
MPRRPLAIYRHSSRQGKPFSPREAAESIAWKRADFLAHKHPGSVLHYFLEYGRAKALEVGAPRLRHVTPPSAYRTADIENIIRYGATFLATHQKKTLHTKEGPSYEIALGASGNESLVGLRITHENHSFPHFVLQLGFERKTIIVEAMQGQRPQNEIRALNHALGEPCANRLLRELEEHARKNGFKTIKIRTPESLHYYQWPLASAKDKEEKERKVKAIRASMHALYGLVAKTMGYKKKGAFFIRTL